jgi:predicted flavoprotein YhiN
LLRQEADRLRVREQTNCPVTRIERRDLDWSGSPATVSSAAFRVTAGETAWLADAIVLATGGQAAPALGSDGSGYTLAAQLGHSLIEPFPALVQICTAGRTTQAMTGIRFAGSVRLMADDQVLAFETGEILFTDYGVSGIPILQLSRRIGEWQQTARTVQPAGPAGELSLRLDLVPDFSTAELLQMLGHRQRLNPGLTAADFLTGLVHKRIGQQLVRECGIALDCRLSQVSQMQVQRLADILQRQLQLLADLLQSRLPSQPQQECFFALQHPISHIPNRP